MLEERGETEHGESEELASQLSDKEREIASLQESLDRAESALGKLEARYLAEKEAMVKDAALDRYKALEVSVRNGKPVKGDWLSN